MNAMEAHFIATSVMSAEGLALDRQQWDDWLAMYTGDAVYWVPGWRTEHEPVTDVQREVSQIYHTDRHGLAERVVRIRSRKSVTAMPLPRTAHFLSNVVVRRLADPHPAEIEGMGNWTVHSYDPRTSKTAQHFGHVEFTLRRSGDDWLIARKKVLLLNDRIPTILDFYVL